MHRPPETLPLRQTVGDGYTISWPGTVTWSPHSRHSLATGYSATPTNQSTSRHSDTDSHSHSTVTHRPVTVIHQPYRDCQTSLCVDTGTPETPSDRKTDPSNQELPQDNVTIWQIIGSTADNIREVPRLDKALPGPKYRPTRPIMSSLPNPNSCPIAVSPGRGASVRTVGKVPPKCSCSSIG